MQSQADARVELAEGGLQKKMLNLENVVATEKADAQLAALKQEMGLAPPVQQEEDALAKLKAEIGQEQPQTQTVQPQ